MAATHTAPDAAAYTDIPLFNGIDVHELQTMMGCLKSHVVSYPKGSVIITEDEDVRYVGVVLSGRVHMVKSDIWGHETLMAYMERGDLFGESFALSSSSRSYVTFTAASAVEVCFLSLANVLHPCHNQCPFHLRLSQNLFALISRKNVELMEKTEVISKSTLREKILTYLSLQAEKQGSRYVTVPLNRTQMAEYLCTNRSAMSRELNDMKKDGLIDFDGNTFSVK